MALDPARLRRVTRIRAGKACRGPISTSPLQTGRKNLDAGARMPGMHGVQHDSRIAVQQQWRIRPDQAKIADAVAPARAGISSSAASAALLWVGWRRGYAARLEEPAAGSVSSTRAPGRWRSYPATSCSAPATLERSGAAERAPPEGRPRCRARVARPKMQAEAAWVPWPDSATRSWISRRRLTRSIHVSRPLTRRGPGSSSSPSELEASPWPPSGVAAPSPWSMRVKNTPRSVATWSKTAVRPGRPRRRSPRRPANSL